MSFKVKKYRTMFNIDVHSLFIAIDCVNGQGGPLSNYANMQPSGHIMFIQPRVNVAATS